MCIVCTIGGILLDTSILVPLSEIHCREMNIRDSQNFGYGAFSISKQQNFLYRPIHLQYYNYKVHFHFYKAYQVYHA